MVNELQQYLSRFRFSKLSWEGKVLFIAGIYNILWGSWAVFFPKAAFEYSGAEIPNYLELWQCVGMIVAVYGVGYFIASSNPYRHWPITVVGLLGKVFGPIGFIKAIIENVFPIKFGINIIFNDLIWWLPFVLILRNSYLFHKRENEAYMPHSL